MRRTDPESSRIEIQRSRWEHVVLELMIDSRRVEGAAPARESRLWSETSDSGGQNGEKSLRLADPARPVRGNGRLAAHPRDCERRICDRVAAGQLEPLPRGRGHLSNGDRRRTLGVAVREDRAKAHP